MKTRNNAAYRGGKWRKFGYHGGYRRSYVFLRRSELRYEEIAHADQEIELSRRDCIRVADIACAQRGVPHAYQARFGDTPSGHHDS